MDHSNVFYSRKGEETTAEKSAKMIRNSVGLDLFRINYDVYEGKTGFRVARHTTREDMEATVKKLVEDESLRGRLVGEIDKNVEKFGLTPRYTRPDEKYDELFPKPPSVSYTFAPELDGKKHYFFEADEINGIKVYGQKKDQGNRYHNLYVLYDGWMLLVGSTSYKERLEKDFADGMPDYRKNMTDQLDAALADPDQWANMYFANFLDRVREAADHNQPIIEANNERYEQQRLERERREEEERLQEQAAYEQTLFDAEQHILNRRPLLNHDVRDTSLILLLFRHNDIQLPLRTQGWIKKHLHSIFYDERWTYNYSGKINSTVFRDYLKPLADAIQQKYQQIELDSTPQLDDEEDLEI